MKSTSESSDMLESCEIIPFSIVRSSSEDDAFPASNLEGRSKKEGWKTLLNAALPHYLIIQPLNNALAFSRVQVLFHETFAIHSVEIFKAKTKENCTDVEIDSLNFESVGRVEVHQDETTMQGSHILNSICLGDIHASLVKIVIDPFEQDPSDQIGIVSLDLLTKYSSHSSVDRVPPLKSDALFVGSTHPNLNVENFEEKMSALEELKRDSAQNEDFETAARVKDALISVQRLLKDVLDSQNAMDKAAEEEDYLKASKLKAKRETSRVALLKVLENAEHAPDDEFQCIQNDFDVRRKLDDLSLSTIRRVDDQDEPSVLTAITTRPLQNIQERQIVVDDDTDDKSIFDHASPMDKSQSDNYSIAHNDEISQRDDYSIDHNDAVPHPLDGVPGFEDLPIPEEVNKLIPSCEHVTNPSNSFSSITSTDSINKIEALLGPYCTRCMLSKNWALREAALLKLSISIKDVVAKLKSDVETAHNWWDVFSRGICVILERGMDDKIVQVFLTTLIVLDDSVEEFEAGQASQKGITSLLGNVIMNLIDRIADGNPKVAEGCETLLMSLALSSVVGPLYIGSKVMKLMSPSDSKAINSVPKRCYLLKALVEEFGNEAPPCEKYLQFIQTYCIGNKDVEAREAGKDLAVALYLRDGNSILALLDGLPDRVTKEYQLAFLKAKQGNTPPVANTPPKISRSTKSMDSSVATNAQTLGIVQDNKGKPPGRRGRGRGRGRTNLHKFGSVDEILSQASNNERSKSRT